MKKHNVYEVLLKKRRQPITGLWYFLKGGYYKPLTKDDKLIVEKWRKIIQSSEGTEA